MAANVNAQTDLPPAPEHQHTLPESPATYESITGHQRLTWFLKSTVGPQSIVAGVLSSGLGTAVDHPKEYGPGWEGFGKRFGMRLTGTSTGNVMEASLGALRGEDPRYFRQPNAPFRSRVENVIRLTFTAYDRNGQLVPAYARFVATAGNNFLSNTWRADSEATNAAAARRTAWGILGRMGSNAFQEFWPDVQEHLLRKKSSMHKTNDRND